MAFGATNYVEYTYDANGVKWKKKTLNGAVTTEKFYLGDIEYNGTNLEAIYHTDGRAIPSGSTYEYQYTIKDHLGNSRVMFKMVGSTATLIQENHYYPFGMEMEGSFTGSTNKYRYNGKEWNDDLGLNLYDYGARFYDPSVGRFTSIDPKVEDYLAWSPFNYTGNNPIRRVDIGGEGWGDIVKGAKKLAAKGAVYVAGAANAIASNMTGNFPGTRGNPNDFGEFSGAASAGQTTGDIISVGIGAIEMVAAAVGLVSEGAAAPLTGGATALAVPATAALGAHGTLTAATAINNLLSGDGVVQANDNQGSGTGRGSNSRKPDSDAKGNHSVYNDRGNTTYGQNDKNPSSFEEVKRTDIQGKAHTNKDGTKVETPHTHVKGSKDVRRAVKGKDY
ncbi:MAG: hypothetical protein IPL46_10120 [Saprospiraceae bacterium]|nr:hypothetical protein [Saprospiraceae bacterium]